MKMRSMMKTTSKVKTAPRMKTILKTKITTKIKLGLLVQPPKPKNRDNLETKNEVAPKTPKLRMTPKMKNAS